MMMRRILMMRMRMMMMMKMMMMMRMNINNLFLNCNESRIVFGLLAPACPS